jgi:hypothetical protein
LLFGEFSAEERDQNAVSRHLMDMETSVPLRLATIVSIVAAVVAVVLRTLTDVSEPALVVAVMIVAFGLSWRATWRDEFTGS